MYNKHFAIENEGGNQSDDKRLIDEKIELSTVDSFRILSCRLVPAQLALVGSYLVEFCSTDYRFFKILVTSAIGVLVSKSIFCWRCVCARITAMQLKVSLAVVDDQGQRYMGQGPLQLLLGVKQTGSIRQAALAMGMSYAKAHRILGRLEQELGVSLLVKHIGGNSRGGAELTELGEQFVDKYQAMQRVVQTEADRAFEAFSKSVELGNPSGGEQAKAVAERSRGNECRD